MSPAAVMPELERALWKSGFLTAEKVAKAKKYDRARFYPPRGTNRDPSVTTILGIIDKSGPLMTWAVKEERAAFERAILNLLTDGTRLSPDTLIDTLDVAIKGAKAADRTTKKAADIGTAAHAMIAYECERMMGKKLTEPPADVPEEAELCFMAWQDWAKSVEFKPIAIEHAIRHPVHRYAGTLDWIARVKDEEMLGDYKSGKAVYAESFLQNVAYRAAVEYKYPRPKPLKGLIIRLPKTLEDYQISGDHPVEVVPVPESVTLDDFLAVKHVWSLMRIMQGLPTS